MQKCTFTIYSFILAAVSEGLDAMRCGGCGSKIGSEVLTSALERLKRENKSLQSLPESILVGLGDDAAVMRPPPPGKLLLQTTDFFRSFVEDPFVFGQIAAQHAISGKFCNSRLQYLEICSMRYKIPLLDKLKRFSDNECSEYFILFV